MYAVNHVFCLLLALNIDLNSSMAIVGNSRAIVGNSMAIAGNSRAIVGNNIKCF